MTTSASFTAAATSLTASPAFLALSHEAPPLRRPTVTLTPPTPASRTPGPSPTPGPPRPQCADPWEVALDFYPDLTGGSSSGKGPYAEPTRPCRGCDKQYTDADEQAAAQANCKVPSLFVQVRYMAGPRAGQTQLFPILRYRGLNDIFMETTGRVYLCEPPPYEITMLLLVSGVIITIAIDAVFDKGVSWSLATTTCIGYLITLVSGFYLLRQRPYLMIAVTALATLLFLWLIDILTGYNGWFRTFALPLAVSAALLTAAVIFLNSLSKYRGLNLLATILVALAFFSIITEYLTDILLKSSFTPQWSVVAAASLMIIAGIFIFIHYRLKRGRSLGRLFHI